MHYTIVIDTVYEVLLLESIGLAGYNELIVITFI